MSGAGAGTERPSPAKLRRLDEPTGTGSAAAAVNSGEETARSPTPAGGRGEGRSARARGDGSGHARGGGGGDERAPPGGCSEMAAVTGEGLETPKSGMETPGKVTGEVTTTEEAKGDLETINGCKGSLQNTRSDCSEEENGGLETTREVKEGMETTREDLEIAAAHSLEKNSDVLETPTGSKGSLETPREAQDGLETPKELTGNLGTTNGRRGSLETAVTRCLEQGRRSKGGSEESTPKIPGSVEERKSANRRKAKTPARPRPRNPESSLEATREEAGRAQRWDREQKGGEEDEEPAENLEPTGGAEQNAKAAVSEESAVISLDEDDEDEEEEEERDEGPGRYLAALEAVQLELEAVEEEAARAFRRLRARFCLRRRPHLQRRNRLIQHIPGFWVTAFLNHPQLSAMISDRDEDALSYMTSLQVEEFGQSHPGCRIRFFFSVNPYFQNDVVAKEFVRGPSGHLVSHSTPIRWWQGQDPRSRPHKGPPAPRSFFAWFGDHSAPAGDRVAEIIKDELWPNPLQFYLLGEGPEGPPDSESGEDCVVILDDDEDVQEIPDDGDGSGVEEIPTEEPPVGHRDPKI
ncbi:putative testis-specific Y-encoded-like protein 3 [Zonotrichia leucophrys gambelii]|uniref:putative testis-specific Y-encoded-like protein 3 n=1 Tax=Zonotrichia leucophrys gambelii TaxID=257770 RepID=UPI00314055D8